MNELDEFDPWSATKEEQAAHSAKLRAIEEAAPDFHTRRKNIRTLSGILGYMLYPPSPFRSDSRLEGGRIRHMSPPAVPMQKGQYPCNADERLWRALEMYCRSHRKNQHLSLAQERENLNLIGAHSQQLILESCEIAKWPYKLGAALYLHQQMAVRQKDCEPSQGKAQWLVANAPVKRIYVEGIAQLRSGGGEPSKIGDQWNKYFAVAHYWAAFVVWAKAPLDYSTDSYALIDFVCNADPDDFFANAAAFRKFRAEQPTTRTKTLPFIKQGIDFDSILDEKVPTSPFLIPDLLAPYQWAALKEYKTRKRPNRSTG